MNDLVEKRFKAILKDHELPYDPSAWEQLAGRLDVLLPEKKVNHSLKWYLGGISLLLCASVFLLTDLSNQSVEQSSVKKVAVSKKINTPILHVLSNQDTKKLETHATKTISNQTKKFANTTSSSSQYHYTLPPIKQQSLASSMTNLSEDLSFHKESIANKENLPPFPNEYNGNLTYPMVKNLCQGESIWIKNENNKEIYLTDHTKIYSIPVEKGIQFTAENPGNYFFGSMINGKIKYAQTPDFQVKEAIKTDFTIDNSIKYDQGIPTTVLTAQSNENIFLSWKVEGMEHELSGREVKLHLFDKGNYQVILTAQSRENNCVTTTKHPLYIDEDYNLLAVNSFRPNSPNTKNASFMPYALMERNVNFSMIIIDPADGAVIFESNDASNGWTGINKNNGQMVDANKSFIWIVKLKNPLPGEKAEYKGNVLRLP